MATTQQVIDALWRACRGVQVYRDLPDGLRRAHLHVLYALEELGGAARVTALAEKALVKIPNMTRLLQETEAAGWTTRSAVPPDKRTVLIRLTEAGTACLQTYYWDYLDAIAESLRPEEHPQYDAMIAAIDQAVATIQQVTATIDET
jgi:DNA-binding MarR family transcriptional regulator